MHRRRAVAPLLNGEVVDERTRHTWDGLRGKDGCVRVASVHRCQREGSNNLIQEDQRVTRPIRAVERVRRGLEDCDKLDMNCKLT